MRTDKGQDRIINILIASVSALGGIALMLGYFNQKRHLKLSSEILLIDKQIKELELKKLKNNK
jgi:hypothetical protein